MLIEAQAESGVTKRVDAKKIMQWVLPTARGPVVLKDGLVPWTTHERRRNIQEKQSPALPGLKIITQVLMGEVLGIVRRASFPA